MVRLPKDDSLNTDDFDVADGSASVGGWDYTDGADSALLVYRVPGDVARQIVHGAQLKVAPDSNANDEDIIAVAFAKPGERDMHEIDSKRMRSYNELSWSEQNDRNRNDFTKLDLADLPGNSLELPEDMFLIIRYEQRGANTVTPGNFDLELEARRGSMDDLTGQ